MNRTFLIFCLLGILGCKQNQDPIAKLNDVVQTLNNETTFEYISMYDIFQYGMNTRDTSTVYIEKSDAEGKLPLKYVFKSPMGGEQYFDGNGFKTIIKNERTIVNFDQPPMEQITNNVGLINSPFYVLELLSYLLDNDPDAIQYIGDTLINNRKALKYDINIDFLYLLDGTVLRNGDLLPNQLKAQDIKKHFEFTIDAVTNYPVTIKEIYDNGDYMEASLKYLEKSNKNYAERAKALENKELLQLNMEEFMQIQMSKQKEVLMKPAADFTLPIFPKGELSLAELKGAPVLLEFWFPGCAFCIKAVPNVNDIFAKYKTKGLKVYGVEFSGVAKEQVAKYIEQNNTKIPMLYDGKSMSLEYGVNSGPTFILLDKNHNVVYFKGGLDEEELTAKIEEVL